jgi:fumarate reductase flavoprotein subunit
VAKLAPEFTDSTDVVVIGGGNAGLMAAIEAADHGASVILLQKNAEVGGKSSWAIGSITAGGTSLQKSHGIDDDREAHRADIKAWTRRLGADDDASMEKLDLLIDRIPDAVERLLELGVRFSGPHPETNHSAYRMHVFTPHPMAAVSTLGQRAIERGVHIRCDSPAISLIHADDGAVIGVQTSRRAIRARRAVVLASGDYSATRADRKSPDGHEHAFRSWATGDGQVMAADAGAAIERLDEALHLDLRMIDWPYMRPDPCLFEQGAFIVTRSGRRITNELELHGLEIARTIDEDLFVILDATLVERLATAEDDGPDARDGWQRHDKLNLGTFPSIGYAYMQDILNAGQGHHGTLPEIANALAINSDALQAEVADYAAAMREGQPDPHGRPAGHPPDNGPYLAMGPGRFRCYNGPAAVRSDLQMRALRPDNTVIPGLYVAGNTAAKADIGYKLGGHGYGLGWAVVSGQLAGIEAAACPVRSG